MSKCPSCSVAFSRRDSGGCPHCYTELIKYEGVWVESGVDKPPTQIIREFDRLLSKRESARTKTPVVFLTNLVRNAGFDLAMAKRLWLLCEKDTGLALHTIGIIFSHDSFNWKTYSQFKFVDGDFPLALAITRGMRAKLDEEEQRLQDSMDAIDKMEDIFG